MLKKKEYNEENKDTPIPPSTKGKIFYGWIVALAGACALATIATFQYSFGPFVKPLIYRFGWSRTAVSACATIRYLTNGATGTLIGVLTDRYNPRIFMLTGLLLVGVGYLLGSRTSTLWQLYLFLGAFTGMGLGFFLVPMISTVTWWFGGRNPLAHGIAMCGFQIAQILTPPLATYIILEYSIETCFLTLGVMSMTIGTGAWLFIKTPPDNTRRTTIASPGSNSPTSGEASTGHEKAYTLTKALHTRAFWFLIIINLVIALCFQMVIIHIIPAATDIGIAPESAAIIVTISGISGILGRLIIPGIANKVGSKPMLNICLAVSSLMLFYLTTANKLSDFYVIATVYGLCHSGISPLFPTMLVSFFGTGAIGSTFGSINTAYTIGAGFGPLLAGYVFDVTQSYYLAFLSIAVTLTVVFLLSLLLKPPKAPVS